MKEVKQSFLALKLRMLRGQESLYSVSKATGISRGTLYRYEQSILVPEDVTLEKLSDYFETPFKELKKLVLADMFPEHSSQREILIEWVQEILACE